MRSFHLLPLSLIAALLTACGTRSIPGATPPLPAAPPRAIPVVPAVSQLRETLQAADRQTALIHQTAEEVTRATRAAREKASELAKEQSATPEQLTRLWHDLQSVEARNLFLETQTKRLTANLTDARATAATLQQAAAAKDAEAEALRQQHSHLSQTVSHYSQELHTAHKATLTQRTKADELRGEIRLHRLALGIAGLLLVLYLAARFLLPRIL